MTSVRWNVRLARPISIPKVLMALGVVIFALAFLLAVVKLSSQIDEQGGVDECRARVASGVTVASVDRDIADAALNRADAALTLSIGAEVGVDVPPGTEVLTLTEALTAVDEASHQLDAAEHDLVAARDARAAFELDPTEEC